MATSKDHRAGSLGEQEVYKLSTSRTSEIKLRRLEIGDYRLNGANKLGPVWGSDC